MGWWYYQQYQPMFRPLPLQKMWKEITYARPHQVCPVCQGRGRVPAGFYTGLAENTLPEACRRCEGIGTILIGGENK